MLNYPVIFFTGAAPQFLQKLSPFDRGLAHFREVYSIASSWLVGNQYTTLGGGHQGYQACPVSLFFNVKTLTGHGYSQPESVQDWSKRREKRKIQLLQVEKFHQKPIFLSQFSLTTFRLTPISDSDSLTLIHLLLFLYYVLLY